ncbi:hypothetical protein PTTG_06270 [Puccinia triticina 1-1 BBBD Race 1]|uniref:Uncharacterized protein n=1 Tax=Puccinia triticina (isolate 1-1 / race 1 (BBBD)) TaxID=630390 RepID=A0A0C4EZL1_PUCT1|nr:hypothetical protein PTTG_06270 [Puccinia triticina 1-1 BBBD Race 1]WAR56736.1 hypothetical protein PtB15_7B586 [Puccinia triticina]
MHVRQLATILSICLSYRQAIAPPAVFDPSESIKPIVTLAMTPHDVLGTSGLALDATQQAALRESPHLYTRQLGAAFTEAFNTLGFITSNPKHDFTSSILGSLEGYYHTITQELPEELRQKQLKLFRNSFYSRLHDLATELGSAEWTTRAQGAQQNLEKRLKIVALDFEMKHIAPAADKEILDVIEKMGQKIKQDPRHREVLTQLKEMKDHMQTHLPHTVVFEDVQYLKKEQVESALKEIIQSYPRSVNSHAALKPADQKISPAVTHATSARPAGLPPSPPMVTAAA